MRFLVKLENRLPLLQSQFFYKEKHLFSQTSIGHFSHLGTCRTKWILGYFLGSFYFTFICFLFIFLVITLIQWGWIPLWGVGIIHVWLETQVRCLKGKDAWIQVFISMAVTDFDFSSWCFCLLLWSFCYFKRNSWRWRDHENTWGQRKRSKGAISVSGPKVLEAGVGGSALWNSTEMFTVSRKRTSGGDPTIFLGFAGTARSQISSFF